MAKRELPIYSKLTERQRYLLNRLPGKYDLASFARPPEPTEVKRSRKIVDRWEQRMGKLSCAHTKRQEALLRKAKEAIYFCPEAKALAIVQQVEKMLKGCEVSRG